MTLLEDQSVIIIVAQPIVNTSTSVPTETRQKSHYQSGPEQIDSLVHPRDKYFSPRASWVSRD
eukprot:8375363-Prorocentrum_lima.AAC.1